MDDDFIGGFFLGLIVTAIAIAIGIAIVSANDDFTHDLGWKQKVCVRVDSGDTSKHVTTRLCVTGEELAGLKR